MAEEQKPDEKAAAPPAPTPAAPTPPAAQAESLDDPGDTAAAAEAKPKQPTVGEPQQKPEGSTIKSTFNIYFILFVVVVVIAAGTIYYAVSMANKTAKPVSKKTQSLTSDQIAQLKGTTTVVGDTKSTLDVQSNAVFEGQVLVRNDLSTAGDLKVGGNLAIKDLTVNGVGSFNTLNVSGAATLAGSTSIQGDLSIQKGLSVSGAGSFSSLNVGQLSVSSLVINGDFNIPRHITPHVIVTPIGSSAASVKYYVNRDSTGFSIGCVSAPPAGSTFAFDYFIVD
jgi:cytoskeletal protein CcmA (bactofilin family)